jgi:hypothetical protein
MPLFIFGDLDGIESISTFDIIPVVSSLFDVFYGFTKSLGWCFAKKKVAVGCLDESNCICFIVDDTISPSYWVFRRLKSLHL